MDHRVSSHAGIGRRSTDQFGQIAHHHMRTMLPSSSALPFRATPITSPKFPFDPAWTPGEGVLNDDSTCRVNAQEPCRGQEHVRRRLSAQVLGMDRVAVHTHVEECFQLGGTQDGVTVSAGGDDGDLEALEAQLMDEPDASGVGLHPGFLNSLVHQGVLTVPEPAYGFGFGWVVRRSFRE